MFYSSLFLLLATVVLISFTSNTFIVLCLNTELDTSNVYSDNNKVEIDAHKVLEGITEPFDIKNKAEVPAWKQLKMAADQRVMNRQLQQALKEYGYILRKPHLYNEMPSSEKYAIFVSMAKLLKYMGFHQRAEVLLTESLNFAHGSVSPFETHFQLGNLTYISTLMYFYILLTFVTQL